MRVVLQPTTLHWIQGSADDPADLCAHGGVRFELGDEVLLDGSREYTVSAAALYLLRTLHRAHTTADPVGDQLFPCCGFAMYDVGGPDVAIVSCPNGDDFEVLHDQSANRVIVRSRDRSWGVPMEDWRVAVFGFADLVMAFYDACTQKAPVAEDGPGFERFLEEWRRLRDRAA
jgi:hypothetical protein